MELDSFVEAGKRGAYALLDARHGFRGVPRTINGEEVRFSARWSRYYPGEYEPEKVAFVRASLRPGDVAIDLGAHIGLFAVHMARGVGDRGRVLAFEPAVTTRDVLSQTVALNGLQRVVDVRDEAVTGTRGTVEFYETADRCSNANSVVRTARTKRGTLVPSTTLAAVITDIDHAVALVKIDIEGGELDVLESAFDVLARTHPRITVEVHPVELAAIGRESGEVFDVLTAAGYRVFAGRQTLQRHDFGCEGCFEVQAAEA